MKKTITFLAVLCAMITSCSDKEADLEVKSEFLNLIDGKIDPIQTWKTATEGEIKVAVPSEGTITVYCEDEDSRVVLSSAIMTAAGEKTIRFDIPSHLTRGVDIYDLNENDEPVIVGTVSREIMVEFRPNNVNLSDLQQDDFLPKRVTFEQANAGTSVSFVKTSQTPLRTRAGENTSYTAVNETPNKAALTGPTNGAKIYGYSTFPGTVLSDLAVAIPENTALSQESCRSNYNLKSNGKFLISMFYGITGNTSREVGYYYYKVENDPSSIEYVPFCDALKYDFLYDADMTPSDALSKTQVKIKGEWYDVNYDHYDRISANYSKSIRIAAHKSDETYCIFDLYERNKNNIEEVRGITFVVDVPVGSTFGFYCGGYQGTTFFRNYTEMDRNTVKNNNNPTAAVRVYNGYRFIGMEDTRDPKNSQADCNDVTFVIVPGGNMPDIRLPYIVDKTSGMYYNGDGTLTATPKKDVLTDGAYESETLPTSESEYAELVTGKTVWTMGFEDLGVKGDYDFNDVVIRVVPIPEIQKAQVTVCAAGGTNNSNLYYKENSLGEIHSLLGITSGSMANTGAGKVVPYSEPIYVDWPEGNTMNSNASDFYIMSKGSKSTVPTTTGSIPTAIAVSYAWQWPREKVNISEAYPMFGFWGANYNDKNYSNWYTMPTKGKIYVGE